MILHAPPLTPIRTHNPFHLHFPMWHFIHALRFQFHAYNPRHACMLFTIFLVILPYLSFFYQVFQISSINEKPQW
jgi:hypothetical protein